jgi:hypothetical protein
MKFTRGDLLILKRDNNLAVAIYFADKNDYWCDLCFHCLTWVGSKLIKYDSISVELL